MPVRHVLIVDDSKSARLMLRKMLQGFGLTVDTVDSAEEALDYLRTQRPDAIFMDHTMPGLDGLTAVRQLKSEPVTAMIPITMYSSKDEPSYQGEAQQAGALGVLVKPATPGALGAALEKMNAVFDTVAARIAGSLRIQRLFRLRPPKGCRPRRSERLPSKRRNWWSTMQLNPRCCRCSTMSSPSCDARWNLARKKSVAGSPRRSSKLDLPNGSRLR